MPAVPDISVVVPSYNARSTIESCLDALVGQDFSGDYEIVVVDSSGDGTAELVARRFPQVLLIRSPERRFPGDARNLGVAASRGRVLAFTDADCIVPSDWLERIAAAHAAGHVLVGGALIGAGSAGYPRRAYHLAAFSTWLPESAAGPASQLASGCLSVERRVFEECGGFREGTLSSDTAFSWQAARRGYTPFFEPSLTILHIGSERRLGRMLARRFANGRAFAELRAEDEQFGHARALVFAAVAPLFPALLFFRLVLAARRQRLKLLLLAPLVLLNIAMWSLGECAGYARWAARSRDATSRAAGLDVANG